MYWGFDQRWGLEKWWDCEGSGWFISVLLAGGGWLEEAVHWKCDFAGYILSLGPPSLLTQ